MPIDKVQTTGVQSGGFSAGAQNTENMQYQGPVQGSMDFLSGFVPSAKEGVLGAIQAKQNSARMQGIMDQNAGALREQSWWTEDAYKAGVNISTAAQDGTAFENTAAQAVRANVAKGTTLEDFTKEFVNPYLANLADKGADGSLPPDVLKQVSDNAMQSAAGVQASYVKAQQSHAIGQAKSADLTFQAKAADVIANPEQAAENIPAMLESTAKLLKATSSTIDPDNADHLAGQKMGASILSGVARVDASTPDGKERLKHINAFLSSEAGTVIKPEEQIKIFTAMESRKKAAGDTMRVGIGETVDNIESSVARGGNVEQDVTIALDQLMKNRVDIADDIFVASTASKLRALRDRGWATQNDTGIASGDLGMRITGGMTDEKASTLQMQAFTKAAGGDVPKAAQQLIQYGIQKTNPVAVTEGSKLLWGAGANLWERTAKELQDPNVSPANALAGISAAVGNAQEALLKGRSDSFTAIIDGAPAEYKSVLLSYLKTNTGPFDVSRDIPKIKAMAESSKTALMAKGGASSVKFDDTLFKSSWFGSLGRSTAGAELGSQASDAARGTMALVATRMYTDNKEMLHQNWKDIPDGATALKVMQQYKLFVQGANGMIPMAPVFRKGLEAAGGGAVNDEYIAKADTLLRDKLALDHKTSAKDIMLVYNPDQSMSYMKIDWGGGTNKILFNPTPKDFAKVIEVVRKAHETSRGLLHEGPATTKAITYAAGLDVQQTATGMYVQVQGQPRAIPMDAVRQYGNTSAGTTIVASIMANEGWLDNPKSTDGSPGTTIGYGVHTKGYPRAHLAISKAQGYDAKVAIWVDQVMRPHAIATQTVGQAAGLPPLNGQTVKPSVVTAYTGLSNMIYHGGIEGGTVYSNAIKLANLGKTDEAQELVRRSKVYKKSGSAKQAMLLKGISTVIN